MQMKARTLLLVCDWWCRLTQSAGSLHTFTLTLDQALTERRSLLTDNFLGFK
jgi:hypothetical protein